MKFKLIVILTFIISSQVHGQISDYQGVKILDTITYNGLNSNRPYFILCDQSRGSNIDRKANYIIDSLKREGVDSFLYYRNSYITLNGYGKVLWKSKGIVYEIEIDYINSRSLWGIIAIEYKRETDDIFDSLLLNELGTTTQIPQFPVMEYSHDSEHYLFISMPGKQYCFYISNSIYLRYKSYPFPQIISKLIIEGDEFFKKLKKRAKNYS